MAEHFPSHLSDTDTLLWDAERDPLLRSTIVAVALLDQSPDWERLRDRLERTSRIVPRFRQRVLDPPLRLGPPQWSADPYFDLGYHLRRVRMAAGGDAASLIEFVRPITMSTFDRARPLWEFTLVEGLDEGAAALVMKVHHAVTDGVAGMRIVLSLLDTERDAPEPPATPATPIPSFGPAAVAARALALTGRRAADLARDAVAAIRRLDRHPGEVGGRALRTAGSVARFFAPAFTPRSPLMRDRGLERRLGTIELELGDLRRAARAGGGTLNDAFVAGVTGGLAEYHRGHNAPASELRMMIPINVRSDDDGTGGGNQFTTARVTVPTNIDDAAARMRAVRAAMQQLRAEPAVAMTESLATVLGRLPRFATASIFGSMLKGADFVTSNVPGAPFPVYLSGAQITRLFAFPPTCGAAANVTLVSHCGTCCIGVITDSSAVPDADHFVDCVRKGLDEVLAIA